MWNHARNINATANLLTVLAVLALLGGAMVWLVRLPAFEFKKIEIAATPNTSFQYVSADLIRSAIAGQLYGSFFTMDLGQTRKAIESSSWVRKAEVRRVWPNILRVTIEEQTPQALWNQNELVNTWGEVFTANRAALENEASFPQFAAPEGTEGLMVQRYAELTQWFEQIGIQVSALKLTGRYALQVTLSNGLTLDLGRDPGAEAPDPQAGVPGAVIFGERVQRFVRKWPAVMARIPQREVRHVDLRYPDGFALTLAPLPEPKQPQKKR